MPGVRLHHPTLRNALLAVPSKRVFAEPKWCGQCSEPHRTKHYHVILDAEGDTIVSETVYNRIMEIGTQPFLVMNEVADPPPVNVAFHSTPQRESRRIVKQIGDAIQDVTPRGLRATILRG